MSVFVASYADTTRHSRSLLLHDFHSLQVEVSVRCWWDRAQSVSRNLVTVFLREEEAARRRPPPPLPAPPWFCIHPRRWVTTLRQTEAASKYLHTGVRVRSKFEFVPVCVYRILLPVLFLATWLGGPGGTATVGKLLRAKGISRM